MSNTAQDYINEANKLLSKWTFFGLIKQDNLQIGKLFYKAATQYKIGKFWWPAGDTYIQAGKHFLLCNEKVDYIDSYMNAAKCYEKISSEQATKVYKEILQSIQSIEIYEKLIELYMAENDIESAIIYCRKLIEYSVHLDANKYKKVTELLGDLYCYQENWEQALFQYKQISCQYKADLAGILVDLNNNPVTKMVQAIHNCLIHKDLEQYTNLLIEKDSQAKLISFEIFMYNRIKIKYFNDLEHFTS